MIFRLIWLVCFIFFSPLSANEKIISFHSEIRIQQNGDLHVLETIHVEAENKQIKRGIYRDFPTLYKDKTGAVTRVGFTVLSVTRDGVPEPYHLKQLSNGQRIYMGDSNIQLSPGEYHYQLEYTTNRQLGFFENYDELYWNVTGNGWSFPILQASANVILPRSINSNSVQLSGYTGPDGSTLQHLTHRIQKAGQFYYETTRPLAPKEGLTIVASWPKGIIDEPGTAQQREYYIQDNKHQLIALAGLFIVFIYYLIIWIKVGKDPETGVIMPRYQAPDGFSPASTRFIDKMAYDNTCFTTALVNLTIKGVISIDQTAATLLGSGQFTISKENKPGVKLAPGEAVILKELFSTSNEIVLTREEHKRMGKALEKHETCLREDYEKLYFLGSSGKLVGKKIALLRN